MAQALARKLVACLPARAPGLFNPWAEACRHDSVWNGPEARLGRLEAHLDRDAEWILCGEAPGYLGCRYSGIAFTSERLLLSGAVPNVPTASSRLTTAARPLSEPSATIVWETLYRLGIAERVVLWNALQLHPHEPGNVHSNRTPTTDELALGADCLAALLNAFPKAKLIAVGNKAALALTALGIQPIAQIRHPANGGKREFVEGLGRAVRDP